MKLYNYYRSSTSYRLRCALQLKRIDYEYIAIDLLRGEHRGDSYRARDPYGTVPLLVADDRNRAQSMAQIEWLEEAYPRHPLLPDAIEDRFTARELAYAIATELHAPLNSAVLTYLKDSLGHDREAVDRWYRHWLARTLEPLERRLADLHTGDFLFDRPGFFEIVLLPQIYNARRFHFPVADLPHVARIEAACLALPEFQRAHPDAQPDNPDRSNHPAKPG